MVNFVRFATIVLLINSLFLFIGCGKPGEVPKDQSVEKQQQVSKISDKILNPDPNELNQPAPEKYQVKFETSKGDFVVEVYRDWSPYGADRLYYLVKNGFYDGVRFFRVISGFMAQFGYHGDPRVTAIWSEMTFLDDPVTQSNARGYVTFAKRADPNSRSTNLFINLVDNSYLDASGFSPLGKVIEGMAVVDQLYSGYGEGAPRGNGPEQGRIAQEGNEYLDKYFPNLDFIKKARVL
jgi:peptidyl-prolyl cis-trans isomerase A (cyclophilin A)